MMDEILLQAHLPGGWEYVASTIIVSLYVSLTAIALSTLFSLPVALVLGFREFRGKRLVTAIINTGMGFPSVVVGLVVLIVLSNRGPLGSLDLVFTPKAMIISQFVLATPVILSICLSAIESVDQSIHDTAVAMGGKKLDVWLVVIKEARYGIVTGILAGFGRAISEVGSVLIVGGNIVYSDGTSYTRTLTTAITVEARQGRYELGLVLGVVLLTLVLVVNVLGSELRARNHGWRSP